MATLCERSVARACEQDPPSPRVHPPRPTRQAAKFELFGSLRRTRLGEPCATQRVRLFERLEGVSALSTRTSLRQAPARQRPNRARAVSVLCTLVRRRGCAFYHQQTKPKEARALRSHRAEPVPPPTKWRGRLGRVPRCSHLPRAAAVARLSRS